MPRRRAAAAPARSAPSRPTTQNRQGTPQQPPNRSSSTVAQPPAKTASGATSQASQSGQSSGLFGQMASTAAGVAVGSSIGHAVGGWFGGNSGVSEAQNNGLESQQVQDGSNQNRSWTQESCEPAAKGLTSCLDQNNGNMQICTWYLDQLKSCQAAASHY